MGRFHVACVLAHSACLCGAASGQDFEWTGKESCDWFDNGNWTEGGQPTENIPGCDPHGVNVTIADTFDPIFVKCEDGSTVELGSLMAESPLDIGAWLQLDGDSILISPASVPPLFRLIVNDITTFEGPESLWDRGDIQGTGFLRNTGTFTIRGPTTRPLRIDLLNSGTVKLEANIDLQNGQAGPPSIYNSGTWNGYGTIDRTGLNSEVAFSMQSGATLSNDDPDHSEFLWLKVPLNFEDGGTVVAITGDIRISHGGTFAGSGFIGTDEDDVKITIDLLGGAMPFNVTGRVDVGGPGTVELKSELDIASKGQVLACVGNAAEGFLMGVNTAHIDAVGDFSNGGLLTWKAGMMTGEDLSNSSDGVVRIAPGGNGTPTLGMFSTFDNVGTWVQTADFVLSEQSCLDVRGGGVAELRAGDISGSGNLYVRDGGTLKRPMDAGDATFDIEAYVGVEGGSIECEAGTIALHDGGGFDDATIGASKGATISLGGGGNYFFVGQSVTTGSGFVSAQNATFHIDNEDDRIINALGGGGLSTGGALNAFRLGGPFGSGTLTGPGGQFQNTGTFLWENGVIDLGNDPDGSGRFINEGLLQTIGGNLELSGQIRNEGGMVLINHTMAIDAGRLTLVNGTVSQNATIGGISGEVYIEGGTWIVNGDADIDLVLTMQGGLLRKTGSGTSTVLSLVNNPELDTVGNVVVIVEGGTLQLNALFEFDPFRPIFDFRIAPGAKIRNPDGTVQTGIHIPLNQPQNPGISEVKRCLCLAIANGPIENPVLECEAFVNGGRFVPGTDDVIGGFDIVGDYEQTESGILVVQAAPMPAASGGLDTDVVHVNGDVTLGGTLRMNVMDGFEPFVGQQFEIMTATGVISSAFDTVIGEGAWSVETVGQSVIATCEALATCDSDVAGGDGAIDSIDLLALLGDWGFAPSAMTDLNGDDRVDVIDLLGLLGDWGACDES